jgi:resuscitation-promoting factor RpfC
MRTRQAMAALAVVTLTLLASCGKDTFQTATVPLTVTTTEAPASTTTTIAPAPDPGPYVYASMLAKADEDRFYSAVWAGQIEAYFTALRSATPPPAPKAQPVTQRPATPASRPAPAPQSYSGGGTPPNGFLACVRNRESRGSYTAVNSSSGAGGAYQFLPSTWHAIGGTGLPQNAPPAVQDAMAAKLYAQSGRAPWAGPGC